MAQLMENFLSLIIIGAFLTVGLFLFHGVSPDKLRNALMGVLAGLVAGTICLFTANTEDPRVQYQRDVAVYKTKLRPCSTAHLSRVVASACSIKDGRECSTISSEVIPYMGDFEDSKSTTSPWGTKRSAMRKVWKR